MNLFSKLAGSFGLGKRTKLRRHSDILSEMKGLRIHVIDADMGESFGGKAFESVLKRTPKELLPVLLLHSDKDELAFALLATPPEASARLVEAMGTRTRDLFMRDMAEAARKARADKTPTAKFREVQSKLIDDWTCAMRRGRDATET
jgi:hypothetical protein